MNSAEAAAYIGAAAWLPQILSWIYSVWTRPQISVIPNKKVQIGFTSYGPIFNLKMALAVERKDVVVDSVAIYIKHEKGANFYFEWAGLHENLSEISDLSGNARQVIEKNQDPIAIKLSTVGLIERFVRFQDPVFHAEAMQIANAINAKRNFLKKKETYKPEEILDSQEKDALSEYYKTSFRWVPGKYIVSFDFKSPQKIKVKRNQFVFELQQVDVDSLKANFELVEKSIKDVLAGPGEQSEPWNWVNPIFKRV